jgi:antitoxin VapB
MTMPVTRVFQSGNSQAVRLPKEFRFQEEEVVIKRVGDAVMLFPMRYAASVLKAELDALDADFQIERNQPKESQNRDFDS